MTDRTELLEAALDSRPEGIALLGADGAVVFWNRSAEAITGYASIELLSRPIPDPLESLLLDSALQGDLPLGSAPPAEPWRAGASAAQAGPRVAGHRAARGIARRAGRAHRHGSRFSSRREP